MAQPAPSAEELQSLVAECHVTIDVLPTLVGYTGAPGNHPALIAAGLLPLLVALLSDAEAEDAVVGSSEHSAKYIINKS